MIALAAAGAMVVAALCFPLNPALAQEEADPPQAAEAAPFLLLELNALQPSERGCRFTFLASNGLGAELTSAAFELALFDRAGMISRLTIVDFKDLPEGKSKVRQFDFSGIDCADVGRVLVNDATECVGDVIATNACIRALRAQTRSEVVFGT